MVSTSKILTVSYGTFSCTLEGFDDSFETMKAIAEYFRDLASEDRYFGAEPPVPDAEMLARIAEREIARRVEAREERGSIVLRAAPYGAVAAPLAPQPAAPQVQPQPEAPQAFAPAAPEAPQPVAAPQPAAAAPAPAPASVQPQAPQPAVVKAPAAPAAPAMQTQPAAMPAAMPPVQQRPTPVPHPDPESVAAKLQRIRDVVTRSAPIADADSEDEHAEHFAEEFLAEATTHIESALSLDDQAMEAPTEAETDEIDALLSRLAGDDTAYAPAAQPDAIDEVVPQVEDAAQADDTDAADLDDTVAETVQEDAPDTDLTPAVEAAETTAEAEEEAAEEIADVAADQAVETFLSLNEDDIEIIETAETEIQDQDIAADDAGEQDATALARVMKIKREDLEAAIARGELVEDAADADPAALADESAAGTARAPFAELSPEKEDELRRELAAVEAELLDLYRDTDDHAAPAAAVTSLADLDDDEDAYEDDEDTTSIFDEDDAEDDSMDADADEADEEKAPLVLREPRDRLGKVTAEDDMSRLMAKTENELTEPEGANRRNAIAHLRAAVAATKADQSAGVMPNRDPAANVFREDLASVMRPRRPVTEQSSATPRPSDVRPAPLKLVAEQRVDLPEARSGAPVRPRRVSLAPLPEDADIDEAPVTGNTDEESGFADFARKMGATSLPDLLEAAAAYLVHVEAREEFSRPQLMKKARQGSNDMLSREDGLRAFGQLLRQGKIQKIRAGRFTASEDISFKPAARRAG
jgi:hypothetical protein